MWRRYGIELIRILKPRFRWQTLPGLDSNQQPCVSGSRLRPVVVEHDGRPGGRGWPPADARAGVRATAARLQ